MCAALKVSWGWGRSSGRGTDTDRGRGRDRGRERGTLRQYWGLASSGSCYNILFILCLGRVNFQRLRATKKS